MRTMTETYSGRFQTGKHTYVEALRSVATILQVCSHVLPSGSFLPLRAQCIFIVASHLKSYIQVEERVLYFVSRVQFRVVLLCMCPFYLSS